MLLLFLIIMSLVATEATAQTVPCPAGQPKTVFIWVNGIMVPTRPEWVDGIERIANTFFVSQPALNQNGECVKFDAFYNQSGWFVSDLIQSTEQMVLSATNRINLSDPDFEALLNLIGGYSFQGYRVVLVGHSQGTLYTNIAYNAIKSGGVYSYVPTITSLPDPNKLLIVNIATPDSYVADGRNKYITDCYDSIQKVVPNALPCNVNAGISALNMPIVVGFTSYHPLSHYPLDGSVTQRQVFNYLDDSLPHWNCNGDPNCYFRENYSLDKDHTADWKVVAGRDESVFYSYTSGPNSSLGLMFATQAGTNRSNLKVRTRRDFSGPFTVNMNFMLTETTSTTIGLNNSVDGNAVVAIKYDASIASTVPAVTTFLPAGYTSNFMSAGFHRLTITRSDTEVKLYVDGLLWTSNVTTKDAGYNLAFNLEGNNEIQMKNLSVVRGVNPPTTSTTPPVVTPPVVPPPASTTSTATFTLGPTNAEDVWVTNLYYGGGQDDGDMSIGGYYDYYYTLLKWNLAGMPRTVTKAELRLWKVAQGGVRTTIYLDRVTGNWTEATRWANRPTATNLSTLPVPVDNTWYTIDVTQLYNDWQNGTYPNYGVMFRPTSTNAHVHNTMVSTDGADASLRPQLVLTWSNATVPAVTTGTVGLFVEGYSGSINCSLNGVSVYAPATLTDVAAGSYTLLCTAPQGFYLLGLLPSTVQLTAGGTKSFTVTLQRNVSVMTGSCTANGGTSPLNVYAGTRTDFVVTPSGGTAPYHYMWTGANANSTTTIDVPSAWFSTIYSGIQAVSVRIIDSSSPQQVLNVDCPQLTVMQSGVSPLTYRCTITPSPITLGSTAQMVVTEENGVQPYQFYLPGVPNYTIGYVSSTFVTPTSRGLQTYQGFLQDSGGQVVRPSCSVQVN